MTVKSKNHEEIVFLCTDSEKQIAKLEWFYLYRRPEDPNVSQELKNLLQRMKDMHASLAQIYQRVTGKRFESKMDEYRRTLREKLSN